MGHVFNIGDIVNYAGGRYYISSMRLDEGRVAGLRPVRYGLARTDFSPGSLFHSFLLRLDGLLWHELAGQDVSGITRSPRDVVCGHWEPISRDIRFNLEANVTVDMPGASHHGVRGEVVGIRVNPLDLTRIIYEVKAPGWTVIDAHEEHLGLAFGPPQGPINAARKALKDSLDKGVLGTWQGLTFIDRPNRGDEVYNNFDINHRVYIVEAIIGDVTHPDHLPGGRGPYRVVAISAGEDADGKEIVRYGLKTSSATTQWYDESQLVHEDDYDGAAASDPHERLPRWRSSRVIRAGKVESTIGLVWRKHGSSTRAGLTRSLLVLSDAGSKTEIVVSDDWLDAHWPHDGIDGTARISGDLGYYVVHEEGRAAWMPSAQFTAGYTRIEGDD